MYGNLFSSETQDRLGKSKSLGPKKIFFFFLAFPALSISASSRQQFTTAEGNLSKRKVLACYFIPLHSILDLSRLECSQRISS